MPNIPGEPKVKQIEWFEKHYDIWSADPAQFGLPPSLALQVKNATVAARAAYEAAGQAKQDAKFAVSEQNTQVREMLKVGRDAVNIMKSFIANSGNPLLWDEAGLEPDSPPGPPPDLTMPYDMTASLDYLGDLTVRWKSSQPRGVSGVIFSVMRSLNGGPMVLLDSVGEKEYVDSSLTFDTQMVAYRVVAKRGRQVSPPSIPLLISFGHGAGGALAIASTSAGASETKAA